MSSSRPIDSLDRDSVLDAAVAARRGADLFEAELLAVAAHFADLHPAAAGAGRAGYGDPGLRVLDAQGRDLAAERFAPLAGAGTPEVAEFAPEELAAALGVSGDAAKRLIGEALELRHRLPRLWALVHQGRLQAWKARTVAAETIALPATAAAFVDRHVAVHAARNRVPGPGGLHRLVHEALLRRDPDLAAGREQAALDKRGVWSSHRESTATTTLTIVADTPDAVAVEDTLAEVATGLGALGDRDPLDVRRARAVGILADPQRTLDLLTGPDRPGLSGRPGGTGGRGGVGSVLYLHLDVDRTGALARVGAEERYGALTTELIASWLHHSAQVTVQPVLTVGAPRAATAGYTPPRSMREEVILRDRVCVFPGCSRGARSCDLDHITGWTGPHEPTEPTERDTRGDRAGPGDRGGPDHHGQTHPDNLAPLCRHHHRIKTHGRWRYRHNPDHSHTWTSPTGRTYTVDPRGTRHPDPGP